MSTISNKIDLVVSFDTTGSMYPVLAQVRTEVEKFVKTMFSEFTDLRLGIIAHGDYCDAGNPYTIISKDFTRDEVGLCKFVRDTQKTYGGDADECYELVLNTARTKLNWREDADKIMILIGDASPHGVHYRDNKDRLDWQVEAEELAHMGVKVFAVHALSYYRSSSKAFYQTVAKTTDGTYLTLDQFNEVVDLIKATCYQQGGEEKLNEFITIIRDNGKMTNSMDRNFRRLLGEIVEEETYYRRTYDTPKRVAHKRASSIASGDVTIKDIGKLVPVMPGRFQVMTVDANCDIKGFVTKNGIEFKKGRGFYELSKAETVQQYKEVIMQDRETGEMFTGSQVREELGLQPQSTSGGVKERLHKDAAKKFRVFVQSTSVNRKLIAGTTFLYEVSDIEDTGTVVEAPVVEAPVVEAPVVEETTVKVKKTRKTKEKKEVTDAVTKVDEPKIDEPKVDEPKVEEPKLDSIDYVSIISRAKLKEETKKADKADKEKVKSEKSEAKRIAKVKADKEKAVEKIKAAEVKVADALERYNKSENKKNKTYLANNLKRLAEATELMLKLIEE